MANTTNVTIRMDTKLRKEAEDLFKDFGMTLSSAFVMFAKQSVREQRIPFEIRRNIPNKETLEAIEEVEQIEKGKKTAKTYKNVDALMKDLINEV